MSRKDFKIELKVDKDTPDPDRLRQRHRHGQGGPGEQSGRHRLLRLLQVQAGGGRRRQEDIDIIGQFGVGFYSAFMVADSITVVTRKYGADERLACGSPPAPTATPSTECERDGVGTDIIMHIKPDTERGEVRRVPRSTGSFRSW